MAESDQRTSATRPTRAEAARRSRERALVPGGTTLAHAAAPETPDGGYTRLTTGAGWPLIVREELATAVAGRDDRRRASAAFIQLTDLHITDSESPVRAEYLHPYIGTAHRPHETLGARGTDALVARVNEMTAAPFTGTAPTFAIVTGDSTNNHEHIELSWYLDILNGASVTPCSGDPDRYEGVQATGNPRYWHPASQLDDPYTERGFPQLPWLLHAATRQFRARGLTLPWYCTVGNHDNTPEGTLPADIPGLERFYTGNIKVIDKDERTIRDLVAALQNPNETISLAELYSGAGTIREITPDTRRHPFTMAEFVRAHLDDAATGPGPHGHGFDPSHLDGDRLYYTFPIAAGITGISLDTTNLAGWANGSIGDEQYRWLEGELRRTSSTYHTLGGDTVRQRVDDELFVVFSHHSSTTMGNVLPDPRAPSEERVDGAAVAALLHRFPNVLAWVNGHTHRNVIRPHHGDTAAQSFWEINTASHVDYPQLARSIEITDNADGTLSLFTTLLEADSPYAVDYDDDSPAALASLYRELAYNDPHAVPRRIGKKRHRNAELLLRDPLG